MDDSGMPLSQKLGVSGIASSHEESGSLRDQARQDVERQRNSVATVALRATKRRIGASDELSPFLDAIPFGDPRREGAERPGRPAQPRENVHSLGAGACGQS